MNFNNPSEIITLFFLIFGSVIMVFVSFQTSKVYKTSQTSKYNKKWFWLLFLVALFTFAYFISIILILLGQSNLLIIAFGLIFLMGAIFVSVTMLLNISILQEIYAKTSELKEYSTNLEKIVDQRSEALVRRIKQLRTSAEISQIIIKSMDAQQLLEQVVNLVQEQFNIYYVGVFLIDNNFQYASLKAGSGEAGKKMLQEKHRLSIGDKSMIGWSINHKQARIALDTGVEAIRFNNPHLPLTRSELALPIILGNKVLGSITIQSTEPSAFDQDDVIVLKNIADTLAISLQNSYLFNELEQKIKEIQAINSQYLLKTWTSKKDSSSDLEYTYENPHDTTGEQIQTIEFPLILRDMRIGQLTIESYTEWTEEKKSFIERIANQAALSLEIARLLEENKSVAMREKLVSEITTKIRSVNEPQAMIQTALDELKRILQIDQIRISTINSNPLTGETSDVNSNHTTDPGHRSH